MQSNYEVGVTNRFALFLDDENADQELEKFEKKKENERKRKEKEKRKIQKCNEYLLKANNAHSNTDNKPSGTENVVDQIIEETTLVDKEVKAKEKRLSVKFVDECPELGDETKLDLCTMPKHQRQHQATKPLTSDCNEENEVERGVQNIEDGEYNKTRNDNQRPTRFFYGQGRGRARREQFPPGEQNKDHVPYRGHGGQGRWQNREPYYAKRQNFEDHTTETKAGEASIELHNEEPCQDGSGTTSEDQNTGYKDHGKKWYKKESHESETNDGALSEFRGRGSRGYGRGAYRSWQTRDCDGAQDRYRGRGGHHFNQNYHQDPRTYSENQHYIQNEGGDDIQYDRRYNTNRRYNQNYHQDSQTYFKEEQRDYVDPNEGDDGNQHGYTKDHQDSQTYSEEQHYNEGGYGSKGWDNQYGRRHNGGMRFRGRGGRGYRGWRGRGQWQGQGYYRTNIQSFTQDYEPSKEVEELAAGHDEWQYADAPPYDATDRQNQDNYDCEVGAEASYVPKIENEAYETTPQLLTLDEWRGQHHREKPKFNMRQAGEGVDENQWQEMYELDKKKTDETENPDKHEQPVAGPSHQRTGRHNKQVLEIKVHFTDYYARRGRGRGRGGFNQDAVQHEEVPGPSSIEWCSSERSERYQNYDYHGSSRGRQYHGRNEQHGHYEYDQADEHVAENVCYPANYIAQVANVTHTFEEMQFQTFYHDRQERMYLAREEPTPEPRVPQVINKADFPPLA